MPIRGPFLIIANPTSGRGRGSRLAEAVAAALRSRGIVVDVCYTTGPGDAAFRTRNATAAESPPACIVACGGDGTVQEVASGLAEARTTPVGQCPLLGLAPAGRCNDFARAFGISKEPDAVVEALVDGHAVPVDLGRVNGRYFCTVATVGIDADVSEFVDSMRMPLRGTLAYIYGAVRVLMNYKAPKLRMEGDFGTVERELLLASSANTASYGGAIQIAPHAVATDGQLDICIVDPMSRLRALRLLPSLMAGKHVTEPEVHFHRTRRMSIDCDRPLEIWADGERVAKTPAIVEVVPAALRVLVSAAALHSRSEYQQ